MRPEQNARISAWAPARDVVELFASPSLTGLYAKALGSQVLNRLGVRRGTGKRAFPDTEFLVRGLSADRERLDAFNRLVRGPGRDEIPASFLHIMSFPLSLALMSAEKFPVPLMGLVHLRNDAEQYRRVDPAETLDVAASCGNPGRHRTGTQFEIRAEARSGHCGDTVWRGVSRYLARGVFLDYPEASDERSEFAAPDANALWQLPSDIGRRYGAISGDINPIHTSILGARALGMKSTIAHGMYLAARALAMAQPAGVESYRWSAEFVTPTFIPGTVALRFEERSVGPKPGDWTGTEYQGWNPRTGKKNFSGSVTTL